MLEDTRLPHEMQAGDGGAAAKTGSKWAPRLGRLKDRADVARRDAIRSLRDGSAIVASTGRTQLERAQGFVSIQARRRPLAVTGLAAAAGVLIGLVLRARAGSRSR